jgi:TolB protein
MATVVVLLAGCGGSSTPPGPPDLLFVSTRDGDYALFGAARDGSAQRRLTAERGDPSTPTGLFFQVTPAWSPDGTRIAFSSSRDGAAHLFVMQADGTGTARLTSSKQDDQHPSWSPDGAFVVFAREGAIFRVPAAGGAVRRLGKAPGSAANPAYSPDGASIAYDYRQPGSSVREIQVMSADGSGIRRLTRLGELSSSPAWSPDGERIVFQSNARSGNYEIFSIGANGAGLERETISTIDSIQPSWSADGTLLTFARDGAIWALEGDEERRLTSGEGNDSNPVWRPASGQGG